MSTPEPPSPPDPLLLAIGARVRAARQSRDVTLRTLANASGVSERFLRELEAGRGDPTGVADERRQRSLALLRAEVLDGDMGNHGVLQTQMVTDAKEGKSRASHCSGSNCCGRVDLSYTRLAPIAGWCTAIGQFVL